MNMISNQHFCRINKTIGSTLISALAAGMILLSPINASAQSENCQDTLTCKSSWLSLSERDKKQVYDFADDYKAFMDIARDELSFVEQAIEIARKSGFKELKEDSPLTPGAKYYDNNRDRALSLIIIGEEDFQNGLHVVGAHIDSPRFDLKNKPLYEKGDFALFQTNYHGGIKLQQWTNVPMAIMGRVDKKDGTTVKINVGMNDGDPIFMIPELAPHTDRGYKNRKVGDHIKAEDMDPIIANIPDQNNSVSAQVEKYLNDTYGISRADLVSAELSLVPAMKSRDMGFDRSMVAAYGQDDRVAGFAAMRAIMDIDTPKKTVFAYLVDNEEVGNVNNTGAKSQYFTNLISRLLENKLGADHRESHVRKTLRNSNMISIDVNPGINPMRPSAWEPNNAPRLGYGVNLKLYGRGFNANSEYIAYVRKVLDDNNVPWQTATYKVGTAGGGTIGGEFSRLDMNVIDFGIPILSIHTPFAVSAKVDVYNLYRACHAFFKQ